MIEYESDVIVNRPVEQVYQLLTDVARLDDWTDMAGTHLVSGDKLEVGSQVETTLKMGPSKQTMVFRVEDLQENRRLLWKTISRGSVTWDAEYALEPQGPSSTRVVSSGQLRFNGLLKLAEPLMAGEVKSGEARELVKFKELAEAQR